MPEHVATLRQTWMDRHPNWEFRVWRLEDLKWLRNQRLFDRAAPYSQKADFARYEIVNRFGGVYLDTDMECLRPIDRLLDGCEFFSGREPAGVVGASMFGAIPSHPIVREVIQRLPASCLFYPPDQLGRTSGPQLLDRVITDGGWDRRPRVRIFPAPFFYPYDFYEPWRQGETFPRAYATHHWSHSWKGQRGVRPSPVDLLPRAGDTYRLWARALWQETKRRGVAPAKSHLVYPAKRLVKRTVDRVVGVPPTIHGLPWGPDEMLIATPFETRLLCPISDVAMASELALTGTYDAALVEFLGRRLRRGMTFVDIGADVGFFSILAAVRVKPGRVFAYEGDSAKVEFLRRNVEMNWLGDRIRVLAPLAGLDGDDLPGTSRDRLDAVLQDTSFIDLVRIAGTSDTASVLDGMSELLDQGKVGAIVLSYDATLLAKERWEASEKALTSLVERRDARSYVPGELRPIPLDELLTVFRYPHLLVRFPGASIAA